MNALFFELSGTTNVIFEIRIAAIDQDVSRLHALGQRLHSLLGGSAGRYHQPGDPGLAQFADKIIERSRGDRSLTRHLLYVVGAQVGDHDFMSTAHQTPCHVGAHLAQTDHSQSHNSLLVHIKSFLYIVQATAVVQA